MNNFKGVPIEFKLNGLQIVPLNKKEKYQNKNYLIYETNIPEFFIKIFRHIDVDFNELFKDSSLYITNELDKSSLSPLKILTTFQNPLPKFWGLLIESFPLNFQEMINTSSHSFDFDIFRFAIQIALYLREFEKRDIGLVHLTEDNIIMDYSGNFQLTNLDNSVSTMRKGGEKGKQYITDYVDYITKKRKDSPLAPEVVHNKEFGVESLIWDFGVLLCKAFAGIYPHVDYNRKKVILNFENKKTLNKSRKFILSLISSCLDYNKSDRIKILEILTSCKNALSKIPSLLSWIHEKIIHTETPVFLRSYEKMFNMVPTKKFRNDKALKSIGSKKQVRSFNDLPVRGLIKIILNRTSFMSDEPIRELIKLGWSQPNSIVEVYVYIKDKLDDILNSEIRTMKLLLFLYAYISKGSQNSLIVSNKSGMKAGDESAKDINGKLTKSGKANAVNYFLEKIFELYEKNSQNLIYQFSYFTLVKFNLHLEIGHIIDNNFALSKAQIILNYKVLLKPDLFILLTKYLTFAHFFFISSRKYTFDYFQKYNVITLYREIKAVLGLLCNLLSILQFGLAAFNSSNKELDSKKKNTLKATLDSVLESFDIIVNGLNLFCLQCINQGFTVMSAFKIRKKLIEAYANNQKKVDKDLSNSENFSLRLFTKFYLNTLVRMEDPNKSEKVPKQTKTPKEESEELKGDFLTIFEQFYEKREELVSINLDLTRPLSKACFWYEHQFKTQHRTEKSGRDQILTSVLLEGGKGKKTRFSTRSRSRKSERKKSERKKSERKKSERKKSSRFKRSTSRKKLVSKRNIAIQVNLIKKEYKEQKSDRRNRRVDQKMLIAKSLTESIQQKIEQDKKGEKTPANNVNQSDIIKSQINDVYFKSFNVNKFLIKEFRGSLSTWVIHPDKLIFGKTIASGSTCSVYKGTYMNIPVAIKKLKKDSKSDEDLLNKSSPEDDKERVPKFLKEFKREIGLLVSLPNHPNLLTILGFNIIEEHVNIVTEFCHGGTIFDILYKKAHRVKLSFQQQIKILMDICRGMMFLHSLDKQIIHRDLKSLNIFITNKIREGSLDFHIKIADFGLARSFNNENEFVTKRMGTFHWMAPEIFSDHPYNTKTDVYAFAIIMWEVFAGRTPYYNLGKPEKIIKYVYYDDQRPNLKDCKIPKPYEDRIKKIISTNWQRASKKREEFSTIYNQLDKIWKQI